MIEQRVCIVGAGLMGGSLALVLRPFLTHLILVDTNPETITAVRPLADVATADFATGLHSADWLILATPTRTTLHLLSLLPTLKPEGCCVLDLSSTKTDICQVMSQLPPVFQAIGGHPMCGKETSGFAAATPQLYQHQTFILCRTARTTPALETATLAFIQLLGAIPLFLPADTHDELMAAVSHLPYLVSAVLMQTAAALHQEQTWRVSASGFRDTARLAGSNPHMMLDILLTNQTAVLSQLESFQTHLSQLHTLLQTKDETGLAAWLAQTQQQYLAYRQTKTPDNDIGAQRVTEDTQSFTER